jgi:hypothetical protein
MTNILYSIRDKRNVALYETYSRAQAYRYAHTQRNYCVLVEVTSHADGTVTEQPLGVYGDWADGGWGAR